MAILTLFLARLSGEVAKISDKAHLASSIRYGMSGCSKKVLRPAEDVNRPRFATAEKPIASQ